MLILMFSIEESFICLHWINARDIICSHDLIRVTVLVLIAALNLMIIVVIVEINVVLSYLRETSESLLLVIQVTNVPLLVLVLIKNHNSLLFSLNKGWLCFLGSWPVRNDWTWLFTFGGPFYTVVPPLFIWLDLVWLYRELLDAGYPKDETTAGPL